MSSRSKTTYTTRPVATPGEGRHPHPLLLQEQQPGCHQDHDARHRAQIVEGDDVGPHDDDGEERPEPRLRLPERDRFSSGPRWVTMIRSASTARITPRPNGMKPEPGWP